MNNENQLIIPSATVTDIFPIINAVNLYAYN